MERDHAAELTQGAQEAMSALRETYDQKKVEAEPHRQQRKELKETAKRTADKFRCVAMPVCEGGSHPGAFPQAQCYNIGLTNEGTRSRWRKYRQPCHTACKQ